MQTNLIRIPLAVLLALGGTCCGSVSTSVSDSGTPGADSGTNTVVDSGPVTAVDSGPRPGPAPGEAWFDSPRAGANIFVGGHSLIDQVFGWWPTVDGGPIFALATDAGKDHHSLLQSGPGSTAQRRRQDMADGSFDVPDWGQFDTMIILERSDFVDAMVFEQGLESLGWFIDQVRNAPPGNDEIFLYQTWWGYNDGNPRVNLTNWPDWIAHTRAELPLVECASERLGRERGTHVRVMPAGNAVAELIAAVEAGQADGLRHEDIFSEDMVHLSDLGHRYVSMVVFASVYRTSTRGITVPDVSPSRAAFFAEMVDRVVSEYYDHYQPPTATQCRAAMQEMCTRFQRRECDTQTYFGDAVYGTPIGD